MRARATGDGHGMAEATAGDMLRRPLTLVRIAATILAAITLVWSAGLAWYATNLPREPVDETSHTDAIVVLTGGAERLDEGIALLRAGMAKTLFVSGVPPGVQLSDVVSAPESALADLACCVELGHHAPDTTGNAHETALWMAERSFTSLRLVTGSYHMPRSMMEFRLAMPNVRLVPHPVFPKHVKVEDWWRYRGTAGLIASEFAKFLWMMARTTFSPLPTPSTRS